MNGRSKTAKTKKQKKNNQAWLLYATYWIFPELSLGNSTVRTERFVSAVTVLLGSIPTAHAYLRMGKTH